MTAITLAADRPAVERWTGPGAPSGPMWLHDLSPAPDHPAAVAGPGERRPGDRRGRRRRRAARDLIPTSARRSIASQLRAQRADSCGDRADSRRIVPTRAGPGQRGAGRGTVGGRRDNARVGSGRWVLHLDMDAFYAAVEQLTRPTLRDRPVLVGGLGPRGVVAGASYQARVFGARSAMPMGQARRLCPHAVVLPPRGGLYSAVSEQVMAVLAEAAPIVEPVSLDEAFLEPPALAGATPAEVEEFGTALRAAVRARTGLPASVGAGSGKQLAKIASELAKPDGLRVVAPDEEQRRAGAAPGARAVGSRAGRGGRAAPARGAHGRRARRAGPARGHGRPRRRDRHGAAPARPRDRRTAGRAPRGGEAGQRRDHVRRRPHHDDGRARRRHADHGRGAPAPGGVGAGGADGHREDPQRRLHHPHPLGDRDPRHHGPRAR